MDYLLRTQNLILNLTPALIPLAALLYSFLNSWHCSMMCGPFVYSSNQQNMHKILLFRLIGYSVAGSLMGMAGKILKQSLEFELINIIAFGVFSLMTILFLLPQLTPGLPKFSMSRLLNQYFKNHQPSAIRGFLMAAIPCHLLSFYYGIAAISGSPYLGAGLLFGHAVMTTPSLAYTWKLTKKLSQTSRYVQYLLRGLLILMIVINLFYFAGHLFHSSKDVGNHILFCL